jgi:SAM-dependent methyltransferase
MNVDFGHTAADYARHRAGFPETFFERLKQRGAGLPGQTIVDLGTGTGTLARGFARRGCQVIGFDISGPMLEQARRLSEQDGAAVDYRLGQAEQTGLDSGTADVVAAGQCWHWFDGPAAAREAARILRPQGLAVIAHFDWIPLKGNVVEATEQLILDYNPEWRGAGGHGLYPRWMRDLGEAGFHGLETFSYEVFAPYSHEDWRGRIRASAGVGASLTPEKVADFDRDLSSLLQARFPQPVLHVHHRVWALTGYPASRPA